MPYRSKRDLPDPIKKHLPSAAQEMYKEVFNHAWDEYKDPSKRKYGGSREEASHRVAWGAVKRGTVNLPGRVGSVTVYSIERKW